MKGHHFTQCRYCGKEYACGDCITDDCEQGRIGKRTCEYYQAHMRQLADQAKSFEAAALRSVGKVNAGARLAAMSCWQSIAEEMTNAELSEALKELVWPFQKIGDKSEAVVMEAIERLKK